MASSLSSQDFSVASKPIQVMEPGPPGGGASELDALEPSQLTQYAERPLPRQRLRGRTVALLVVLRIYVLIAIPVVVYAFIRALLG